MRKDPNGRKQFSFDRFLESVCISRVWEESDTASHVSYSIYVLRHRANFLNGRFFSTYQASTFFFQTNCLGRDDKMSQILRSSISRD
jgi:hypothetical protein